MTDRPILFSAPMVRALLDGRKTMTRRVQKHDIAAANRVESTAAGPIACEYDRRWPVRTKFAAGDRLWVRETWATVNTGCGPGLAYKADGGFTQPEYDGEDFGAGPSFDYEKYPGDYSMWISDLLAGSPGHKWKPSIHMPRWASRLTLIVTDVRVERLQDISEADAIAEGVERDSDGWRDYLMPHTQCCASARDSFGTLWESINGPGAWQANTWVTVTSFDVHRQNIDQMEAA